MKKRNRRMRKALMLVCCALALVALSVGATLAYLTDIEAVTNTFTVGKVEITLDEADTDNSTEGDNDRDKANVYHLIPGETYAKDPTVHVTAGSEDSWIFVKVENGLEDIEDSTNTIASQISTNGWTALNGVANVYYKSYTKGQVDGDLEVFSTFTLKGDGLVNGTKPDGYNGTDEFIGDYATAQIKVTAYAIQKAGFENDVARAWNTVSAATTNP